MEDTTFDSIFSNSRLRLLKVLFPMMPPENRPLLAVLIRCMEFQQTLYAIHHVNSGIMAEPIPMPQGEALWDYLAPYFSEGQKQEFEKFRQTFRQMRQMQDMMEMASELKDLFPEGMNPQDMDLTQAFNMFSFMNSSNVSNASDISSTSDISNASNVSNYPNISNVSNISDASTSNVSDNPP